MPRLDPEIRVSINSYLRKHQPDLCRHWFDDIEPLDVQSGVLRLLVREPVQLRYLQRQCTPHFTEAAQAVTGRLLAVRFIGPEEAELAPTGWGPAGAASGGRSSEAASYARAESRSDAPLAARFGAQMDLGSAQQRMESVAVDRHTDARSMQSPTNRSATDQGAVAGVIGDEQQRTRRGIPLGAMTDGRTFAAEALDGRPNPDRPNRALPAQPQASERELADLLLPSLDEQTLLSPDYTFDNFVVGPGNRLAHAAAVAVGEKPGRAYNPYFIHGGVGLGKTHLLQAICQTVLRRNPRARICYISCNTFMDLFHDAVRAGTMSDFRSRFRSVDVFVIDDIHFLSKREQTQEEFFHTFNALYQAGRQIVLSSDAAPSEIPDLEERLTSRFSCGLVARIDRPCYETRVAIVKSKAKIHDLVLPDDVPAYIAAKIDSNIRELEGALTKIRGVSMAMNAPITLELAKQALADAAGSSNSGQPTIQMIIDEVSRFFDVKLADLLSKRRHKSIALPRQVCMWLARKHTRYSLEEIGGYFGGRDHTTVMHAIKTVNAKRGGDAKLLADVSRLEEQLMQRVR